MNFFGYFLNLSLQRVILVEPLVHLVDNPFPLVLGLRLMLVEPRDMPCDTHDSRPISG